MTNNNETQPSSLGGINCPAFSVQAVVDWIELQVETTSPTNFQSIKRWTGAKYVVPQDNGAGGAATVFRFRIQDPKGWDDVDLTLTRLPDLTSAVRVSAVEISLDAYGNGADHEGLAEQAARLHKFDAAPASPNRRFGGRWKGDVEAANHIGRNKRLLLDGRVINVGNKRDARSQRVYVKGKDDGGKIDLHPDQHRARFENTFTDTGLHDNGLPDTWEGWRYFAFETLTRFYRFRRLDASLDGLSLMVAERASQIGERREHKSKAGGVRLFSRSAPADTRLNEMTRDALRKLSRHWRSREGRSRVASARGNLGSVSMRNPQKR